jgi:hypothetical protein
MRSLALSSDPLRRGRHECQTLGWSAAVKPRSRAAVRRKAQGCVSDMSDSLGVKVPCAT